MAPAPRPLLGRGSVNELDPVPEAGPEARLAAGSVQFRQVWPRAGFQWQRENVHMARGDRLGDQDNPVPFFTDLHVVADAEAMALTGLR